MKECKEIENGISDTCNSPNAFNIIARTPTPGGQELELWNPIREITY